MSDRSRAEDEARLRHLLEILERERQVGSSPDETTLDAGEEVDLRTLVEELISLRAAVRAETTASRELRAEQTTALERLEGELDEARRREARLHEDYEQRLESVSRRARLDLIEVADRLEVALEQFNELAQPRGRWVDWIGALAPRRSLVDGLQLTLRRLRKQLSDRGVMRLECLGRPFDAETMLVVGTRSSWRQPEGTVVEEVTAGYVEQGSGRPIRTAQVVVVRR